MPAPSFAVLFDFPDNVATAWGSILAADKTTLIGSDTLADTNAFLFGPRANLAAKKDRIDYSTTAFTQASDQQVLATLNANFWFAHYSGSIMATVSTPVGATSDAAVNSAAAEHGKRVGRLLFLLSTPAAKFTAANLPYYTIALITAQAIPRAEPDQQLDVQQTEIVASVNLWIRPDAFPAVVG